MSGTGLIFTEKDFQKYRDWLNLDIESISWQGSRKKDFEDFWTLFFLDGLTFSDLMERFDYANLKVTIGPLCSWLNWLKERYICFVFIFFDVTIADMAVDSGLALPEVGSILRNFFVEKFPQWEDHLNMTFQVGNVGSDSLSLTFKELSQLIGAQKYVDGKLDDEIMPSIEITLYDDWSIFLNRMKRDFFHPTFKLKKIQAEINFNKQIKIVRELILLVSIGTILIFITQLLNGWYEKYLSEKISIYEPQFLWVDKGLKFKPKEVVAKNDFKLELESIESIPVNATHVELGAEEERHDTESEAVLTSWDALPQDFAYTDQEKSAYEENKKEELRDTTFGERKVYRVMMKAVDTKRSREDMNHLMEKYEVSQGDKVAPGTNVPGGIYYNLFVPRKYLKEFLSQVMAINESVLYESRTTVGNPPGKNKVFVWIKNI